MVIVLSFLAVCAATAATFGTMGALGIPVGALVEKALTFGMLVIGWGMAAGMAWLAVKVWKEWR